MELLAPCGNYETFLATLNNGADAVYFAGSKYGARAYADNFSDEEIIKAIKRAHLFNVKTYLTVNTLIKESEWADVLEYIKPFYEAGLDACIVQDIGLISCFSKYFPNMECHVSTQAFITSKHSIKLYKDLGVTRVVLARELSLDEIKEIKNECKKNNIEVETFIHGAMCYSYSGQCLLSSCLGGRSGNRGRCAGPCRLEYDGLSTAKQDSGYLLSMKDQCALELIPELISAGIDSLKIEGRMKKPEYAALVTAMYRKYIDLYQVSPDKFRISNDDLKLLRSFYMRSEIGSGYYHQKNGRQMICVNNPAYSKTADELMEYVRNVYMTKKRALNISFSINCITDNNVSVLANYNDIYIYEEGDIVEHSINRPLCENDIIKQFSKLGDTVFNLENIDINISKDAFLPVKSLNELRRRVCEKLEDAILEKYKNDRVEHNVKVKNISSNHKSAFNNIDSMIKVLNLDQFKAALYYSSDCAICIDNELFYHNIEYFKDTLNKAHNILLIDLPTVIREDNVSYLRKLLDMSGKLVDGYLINNLEELDFLVSYREKIIIAGPGIYTWNKHAYNYIKTLTDSVVCSYELNKYEINNNYDQDAFLLCYGKIPLMQSANCIEKTIDKCNKNIGDRFVSLIDRKNYKFKVLRNCEVCSNTIFNPVPTSLHEECIEGKIKYKKLISFVDEDYETVCNILDLFIRNDINNCPDTYTKNYWKRGVE